MSQNPLSHPPEISAVWQAIERKTRRLDDSGARQDLDYDKFAIYSIVTHSTAIEGSEISFNAHLDIATIHPWVDGNGRTARLVKTLESIILRTFS